MTNLSPDAALTLGLDETIEIIRATTGAPDIVDRLLAGERPSEEAIGEMIPDKASGTSAWIRRANVVGINVRTVGSFWKAVAYATTLPACQDTIHLLPFWEPGVVASLYGIASWRINPEFADDELTERFPAVAGAEAQLHLCVDLLHLLGKRVGLDVVPHTDRFSEIVLCNPSYFEWLKRDGDTLVDHSAELWKEAAQIIEQFLKSEGPAVPQANRNSHTPDSTDEAARAKLLFGPPEEQSVRLTRREKLISLLYEAGLETAPATMGPPYRGLIIKPDSATTDAAGRTWYDYGFQNPTPTSRAFGPLTRYAFYTPCDNNSDWRLDFSRPRPEVFHYLAGHIQELVDTCGFDFMRGDMSHVQMRAAGVPDDVDEFYDPLGFVRRQIAAAQPDFAYFAESFLAPANTMAYGNELDHLEASGAEVTLGNLQSHPVHSHEYRSLLARYATIAATRSVTPSLTVMTGDKDDPRFDEYYRCCNEVRLFLGLFIPHMPSYMALGFELRDPHPAPVANEYYTKLYVFREQGTKATTGPYQFGTNRALFASLQRIRAFADLHRPLLLTATWRWLLAPSMHDHQPVVAWLVEDDHGRPALLCVANTDAERAHRNIVLPPGGLDEASLLFSTASRGSDDEPPTKGVTSVHFPRVDRYLLGEIGPGECQIYG